MKSHFMKSHEKSCQVMPSHAKSGQVIREGLQVPIMSIIQQYIRPTDRQTDRQTWSGIELLRAAKNVKMGPKRGRNK